MRGFTPDIQTGAQVTNIQQLIKKFADNISACELLDGALIENVKLKTGQKNSVGHPLRS